MKDLEYIEHIMKLCESYFNAVDKFVIRYQ